MPKCPIKLYLIVKIALCVCVPSEEARRTAQTFGEVIVSLLELAKGGRSQQQKSCAAKADLTIRYGTAGGHGWESQSLRLVASSTRTHLTPMNNVESAGCWSRRTGQVWLCSGALSAGCYASLRFLISFFQTIRWRETLPAFPHSMDKIKVCTDLVKSKSGGMRKTGPWSSHSLREREQQEIAEHAAILCQAIMYPVTGRLTHSVAPHRVQRQWLVQRAQITVSVWAAATEQRPESS